MEALSRRRFFIALTASVVAAGVSLPVGMSAVDARFLDVDLTMSLDDFAERFLEPAMEVMAEFLETHPGYTVEKLVWPQGRPDRIHGSAVAIIAAQSERGPHGSAV